LIPGACKSHASLHFLVTECHLPAPQQLWAAIQRLALKLAVLSLVKAHSKYAQQQSTKTDDVSSA